jgi:hypothetical protein
MTSTPTAVAEPTLTDRDLTAVAGGIEGSWGVSG